jgi:hypothetical protein
MTLPTAQLTGQAAIDKARSRVGGQMAAAGYCLQFTRECYNVPAVYASALDAARACDAAHPGDRNPAPGSPVWFWTGSVYDHVCFYVGPDEVISTFNEDIRSFNGIASIEANFGGTYAGWGEHLNEHIVVVGSGPTPPEPTPEENEMPWFIRRNDGAIVIVGPTGVRGVTSAQWDVYNNLGMAVFPPGMGAMDPGPFDAVIASLGGIVG